MIAAERKQPAVLIFNPMAGRLKQQVVDNVAERLGEAFDLQVISTASRHHATDLSSAAASEGIPLVIALGGDGHVNEVVNGLAGTSTPLAIIPGGTMNVFARSLGIPRSTDEAVDHLLALDPEETALVDLGLMDEVYFSFAAGCGFDAEVARLVESHLASKKRFGEPYLYWSAFRVLAERNRRDPMTIAVPDEELEATMAIVCNGGGPYAYLMGLPVRLLPDADPEGLDLFALTKMGLASIPWYAYRAMFGGSVSSHRDATARRGLDRLSVRADVPFARHVDGEPLDSADAAEFRWVPGALKVLA